jgi:hypothetical protein
VLVAAFTGFPTASVTWWVELTSTSGDTFIGTPKDAHNPCPKPEG